MKNLFLALTMMWSATAATVACAQGPVVIKGGKFCEKYLLGKIAKERAKGSRLVKLRTLNPKEATLSPDLKKWLRYMREDELIVFELKNQRGKALLLSSTSYGATGLATNLESWRIQIDDLKSVDFWSFSKNPRLVFWDRENRLNYYSVVYSDEFIHNKDWENLTFKLERHRVNRDGADQLLSEERNVKCK